MNRVVHFEIQANNPERAVKFYKEVFGWSIEKYPGLDWEYWIVMTADKESKEPGIHGGLLKRHGDIPPASCGVNAFVCTVQVDNYDKTEAVILKAGGVVSMPKFALKGMAWQGYYLDTEGNIFGIHQADETAQ